MAIVAPEKLDAFLAVVGKWDVETSVLGEVTGDGRLIIDWHGERIVDVDPSTVARRRPRLRPPGRATRPGSTRCSDDSAAALPPRRRPRRRCARQFARSCVASAEPRRHGVGHEPVRLLRAWATPRSRFPDDAGMIRVDEESGPRLRDRDRLQRPLLPARPVRGRPARARRGVPQRRRHRRGAHRGHRLPQLRQPREPRGHVAVRRRRSRASPTDASNSASPSPAATSRFYNQTGDAADPPDPRRRRARHHRRRRAPHPVRLAGPGREHLPARHHRDRARAARRGPTSCTTTSAACPPAVDLARREAARRAAARGVPASALVSSAHDLSEGGLAQALAEGVHALRRRRARVAARDHGARRRGCRDPPCSRSRPVACIVTVPREDDVKFRGPLRGSRLPGAAHRRDRRAGDGDEPRSRCRTSSRSRSPSCAACRQSTLPARRLRRRRSTEQTKRPPLD